jgi:signal transduction histidine kinase
VAEGEDDLNFGSEPAEVRAKTALPRRVILGEFLLPFWAAIMTIGLLVSSTVLLEQPAMALMVLVLIFVLIFGFASIVARLTNKLEIPTLAAWVIVPLTYAFPLSAFFVLKPLLSMQSSNSQIWTMIIFELSLGLFLFFAQLVQLQRKETTQRLEEVNRQLEIISSRLSQELWLNRKRMAALLHGPVQASLYAAAMGMAQTANPSAEYISKAQKEIEAALDQLSNPDRLESETLMSVMNQVKDLWSDSVEIQISIPKDLEAAISQEPLTLDATIEIARELVTNSVKHGKASKIEVLFSYLKDGNFSVEVLDNGTAFSESSNPGYGTKVLTELSLKWERTRSGDTTRSYAEMVLGRDSV